MRNLILLITFFLVGCMSTAQDRITLADTSIGNMPIEVGTEISLDKISQYFPTYKITHQVASGDSADYHLFRLSNDAGELLISFISFINEPGGHEKSVVKLDAVTVHHSTIQDQFGVTPDMPISVAIEKRNDLVFGAGHTDNYLGQNRIWYMFSVNDIHGTQVTKEMAITANPKIESISWPSPRWQ